MLQDSNSLSLNLSPSVFTLLTPVFLRFVVNCFCYVRTCYVFLTVCDVVLLFVAIVYSYNFEFIAGVPFTGGRLWATPLLHSNRMRSYNFESKKG